MHKKMIGFFDDSREIAQKLPAFLAAFASFEDRSCPENGPFSSGVEPFGIEQRSLVMVAEQRRRAMFADPIDTLARVRTVSDDVAETVDLINPLLLDVGQYGVKGIEISMNVAKDRSQGRTPYKLRNLRELRPAA